MPPVPAIVIVAFVPFAAVTTGPGATGTGKEEKVGTTMLVLFAIELPLAKTVYVHPVGVIVSVWIVNMGSPCMVTVVQSDRVAAVSVWVRVPPTWLLREEM